MFYLDHRSAVPIYVQLQTQVKQAVLGGVLTPGGQLPSVRDLASQLAVNPNTIARAYQELEREGVIETLRGRGTFVRQAPTAAPAPDRYERINEALEHLIMEAYRLGVPAQELVQLLERRLAIKEEE